MNDIPLIDAYMARDIISLTPDMDIHQALKILVEHRISGAPVLDAGGNLVGLLSKKDCLNVAFRASYHKEHGGNVSEFMSSHVETVQAGSSVIELADRFRKGRFRRFPVMENGRMVGLIARHDILRAIEEQW